VSALEIIQIFAKIRRN